MITRRRLLQFIGIGAIILLGAVYWVYSEYRTSPLEEAEKALPAQMQQY